MTDALVEAVAHEVRQRFGLRIDRERHREIAAYVTGQPPGTVSELAPRALAALLIGETYFFRYRFYLHLLAEHARTGTGPYRVLCAGCSTGEEAYSVSFVVGAAARAAGRRLEVVGFDVRAAAVDHARAGVYGRWALRALGADEQRALLEETAAGSWRVRDPHRAAVRFVQHSLLEPLGAGPFDAVLACNATLYLEPEAAARAYELLRGEMRAGGLLMTAPTDPAPGPPLAVRTEYGGWPVYGLAPAAEPAAPQPVRPAAPRPGPRRRPAALARRTPPPPWPAPAALPVTRDHDEDLWAAWARGELRATADRVRARVFHEPDAPVWRFLQAMLLREQGQADRARRELAAAAARLAPLPDETRLSPSCTAGELRQLVAFWSGPRG